MNADKNRLHADDRRSNDKHLRKAQTMIEFTFCIIVAILFMHALYVIFKWASVDFANRRIAHDEALLVEIDENWSSPANSPLRQLDENFFVSENNLDFFSGDDDE